MEEVGPILSVWIAILPHPTSPCEQLAVAPHVQEWHLTYNGAKQAVALWPRQHVAHEQAAIGASLGAELLPTGDLAPDEILGHGLEVLVRFVPILLQRCLVPSRAVLAAAADVRFDPDTTSLQPRNTTGGSILGTEGDLKAAVAVQERDVGPVVHEALLADLEIRNLCPVQGLHEELLDLKVVCFEEGRQCFQWRRGHDISSEQLRSGRKEQGCWSNVALDCHPELIGYIGINRSQTHCLHPETSLLPTVLPCSIFVLPENQLGLDVFEHR
mmetsp:Transcript_122459/g.305776  ORF Transcript_122459/g.305776 Transcript_122459/m.305776 type:complete len:271 (-) Transcript_122459:1081-1893(-)